MATGIRQGSQEGNQLFFLGSAQVQGCSRQGLCYQADTPARTTTLVVGVDHLFQCAENTVVRVGCGKGNVPQAGRLEGITVQGHLLQSKTALLVAGRQTIALDVKALPVHQVLLLKVDDGTQAKTFRFTSEE